MNDTDIVSIKASQSQYVPAGDLLGTMYYSGFISAVLAPKEYRGFPHNGGEHSLTLTMPVQDLRIFLGLVRERFSWHKGFEEFIASVTERLQKKYPTIQVA